MRVGVLGASGLVGQTYLRLLKSRPEYEVVYAEREIPSNPPPLIFSALPKEVAQEYEPLLARQGSVVISSSSAFRGDPDVPVIIPEVNPDHLKVLFLQRKKRGWEGAIVAKPNCAVQSFLLPLLAFDNFSEVIVTMLQAVSGAGKKGISAFDMMDNILPYIPGEEEKTEFEPLKILGEVTKEGIVNRQGLKLSVQSFRVPISDGHVASVSVKGEGNQVIERLKGMRGIHYCVDADRPQPRLDRMQGEGMEVSVGRVRPCSVLDYKFIGLSHNAIRGAAGGGIAIADLYFQKGNYRETKSQLQPAQNTLSLS